MLNVGMTSRYRAGIHPRVAGIFQENAVTGGIGNINRIHCATIAAGYTEESATAVAGVDLGAGNIRTVVIGHAKSSIASAIVVEAARNSTDGTIP